MPWRELILHLDYPGFVLPSPEALSLIMTAYNLACREPFPLECVHLAWANPRGQVRLVEMSRNILTCGECVQYTIDIQVVWPPLSLPFSPSPLSLFSSPLSPPPLPPNLSHFFPHSSLSPLPFPFSITPLASVPPSLPSPLSSPPSFPSLHLSPYPITPLLPPLPHTHQLSWYQQALAGCPEFSVSQYMGESLDLEPFKIVLNSEETKPWFVYTCNSIYVLVITPPRVIWCVFSKRGCYE